MLEMRIGNEGYRRYPGIVGVRVYSTPSGNRADFIVPSRLLRVMQNRHNAQIMFSVQVFRYPTTMFLNCAMEKLLVYE